MKVLTGFIVGVLLVCVLGAAYLEKEVVHKVMVEGRVGTPFGIYQTAFSSIAANGDCYFALTDATTGRTEIFKITTGEPNELSVQRYFSDKAFQGGRDGRLIVTPDAVKELDDLWDRWVPSP
jgi:hypothetical protein